MDLDEQCVLCGTDAAVRVGGTSFCASCGLNHYSASAKSPAKLIRRSRRAAFFALFSSGILAKTLLGAVALAAVGGAASTVLQSEDPVVEPNEIVAPSTSQAEVVAAVDTSPSAPDDSDGIIIEAGRDDEAVAAFVAAVQAWSDCVSEAASAHSGGAFDPHEACPDKPRPGDFGVNIPGHDEDGPGNSEDAPGHDEDGPGNSEDAPGHDEGGPGNSESAPGQTKEK